VIVAAACCSRFPSAAAAEELDVSEGELRSVPVLWVQLDQAQEWLAAVTLRQPAHWWALQVRGMTP
jgi:hypothetical protein